MSDAPKYLKIASHEAEKGDFKRCLLLYSGGLDTSVMLKWIQDQYEAEVVALTVDIGQRCDNMEEIKAKALKLGAVEAIVADCKQEFAETLLTKAIQANADYQGGYALSCPLGRVMISKIAVRYAEQYNCQVIAHGCTGKGNDQVRFEGYCITLNPKLKTIAPVREWGMGREEELEYAAKHDIPVKQKKASPYSYDENMWGNTAEGGEIEDPGLVPPMENIVQWCTPVAQAPDQPHICEISFTAGVPTSVDGKAMELVPLIQELNSLGSKHGVGYFPLIEDRMVGLKVRGLYENPAATILIKAHKNLEQLVSTREENEFKTNIDQKWSYLTYGAKYFDPVVRHLEAYIASSSQKVTGTVKVQLFKGQATVVALSSPNTLFNSELATFERSQAFNQNASPGFIELYNLAQKTAYNSFKYNI